MLAGTPYLLEGARAKGVVAELEALAGEVQELRRDGALDDATLQQLRDEWKIEQVYETTGIEGNQLDLNETRLVIEKGITITGKPARDSAEARNMKSALDYLELLAASTNPLRVQDLREIHSLVMAGEAHHGAYRTKEVKISGADHVPPVASEVPRQVDELLSWMNAKNASVPPPLKAAVTHAWLTHIHPFVDGNGRTARALMNLLLIRGGYPIVLVRRRDRNVYYDALASSDDGDIAPLLSLMVKRSHDSMRQIKRVRAEATGLTDEIRRVQRRLLDEYETWRQAMLLILRSIEEAAGEVLDRSDGAIRIKVREYDQVTPEDYLALRREDTSGNGWLAVLRGEGAGRRSELLLWIGFRSVHMKRLMDTKASGASMYFSEPDPLRMHPFRQIRESASFSYRELAFDGGSFWLRERRGQSADGDDVRKVRANEVARGMLREFIRVYIRQQDE